MLYIFHVETGTMMTFDMNLALESVGHLKRIICKEYKIPEEKQVLLISGGESLEPTTRVCSYSAGTDTSPIFLFSKVVIESSSPPLPSVDYGSSPDMKNCVDSCIDMPPTYETVVHRAQLAQQFHDLAKKQTSTCEKLVHDQHLQQQGWAAVVANLDDITSAFRNRTQLFVQNFNQYLKTRGYHVEILHNFSQDLSLLSKIPVLPALLSDIPHHVEGSLHNDSTAFSLLHWINSKDNQSSLEQMADQCLRGLEQFSESMLDVLHGEINDTLEKLDNVDMKEVKGLEARLYGLEKLMFEAHRIVREQSDLAQAFVQNQTRAGNIGDTSILPDLCASHSRQLQLMLKNHMQLEGILQRCIDAKKELSSNLHIRLGWIMYVEGRISDLDNKLSIYHENLKRLKRHLDVVEQIHLTPQVYVAAVVEVVRRRTFSTAFLQWANSLTEHTMHLHKVEVTTRKTFNEKIANHFLHALFPGMEDSPPPFALNRPEPFDQDLPNVFEEDIEKLKQKLPEFAELLVISSKELIQCVAAVPPLSEYISKEKQVSEHELKKYCDVDKDVLLYDEELLTHVDFKQTHNLLGCATGSKKLPVRDWKEVSVEGFEHIGAVERTDTFPKPHKHKNVDFEQKMAMKERQKIFRTQSDGDIKTISKDFSSSDLCFVPSGHPTADFYIDDSMTSSCTDSNAASGPGRGISSLKPKHELVASLQKQLMEKNATLLKTREELQSTKLQLQRFQSTVTTLEELTKQVQQSLRLDLANLQDEVLQRREEVIENILAVSSKVQETIEHLNIQLGSSQEEAALELVNKEHRVELQYYQQLLDVEMHKLEDAHQEIEVYQQQLMSQNDVIDNLKQEFEAGIKKIQSECENERKELEQKLILEQELELEAVRMELRRVQSGEILELTQALKEKDAQVQLLYKDKQSLEEVLTERFRHERTSLIRDLEEEYQEREKKAVEWALQEARKNHQEQLERVQREREQHMDMFQKEVTQKIEEEWKGKLVQLREEMDSERRRELEDKHNLWEKQKEEEIKELQERLDQDHKSEVESLRSRFRLAISTTTMERSPSDSSLEKSQVQKDVVELSKHEEAIANLQQHFEVEKKQLVAQARETEKQIWETKLQSTVEKLANKYENQMAEFTAKLSREHQDHCENLKSRVHAEKQVTFNQAVEQVSREKGFIVESLQKEKEELVIQLQQEKERLESIIQERVDVSSDDGRLLKEALEKEKLAWEEKMKLQTELLEARKRFSESRHVPQWGAVGCTTSTLESVLEDSASENQPWSGTKSLHEQLKPAENQALGHIDKVSVLTCNVGDIILLRYDDRYENYLAFYLGPVLHFLHTDCMENLGLKAVTPDSRKLYALAEVTDKEYCQAKKAQNRYKLPIGSRFYRIKAKPWFKEAQSRRERQPRGGSSSSGKYLGSETLSASTI